MHPVEIERLLADSYGDLPLSLRMIDRFIDWAPKCLRELRRELGAGDAVAARRRLRWLREAAVFVRAGRITMALDAALGWSTQTLREEGAALCVRLGGEVRAVAAYRAGLDREPARPRPRFAEEILGAPQPQ